MKHLSPNARLTAGHSRLTTDDSRLKTHDSLLTTFCFKVLALAFLAISTFVPASVSAADTVNYDTAWTYVYDGGRVTTGLKGAINDNFFDVKALSDGSCYCVGTTSDTANWNYILLDKFDHSGKLLMEKHLVKAGVGRSLVFAKNGDLIIGAGRGQGPFILRADTSGNIKWTTWFYDSLNSRPLYLSRGATINCVRETKRGTFIGIGGDYFTDQNYRFGTTTYDYFAFLEVDSSGKMVNWGQMSSLPGYQLGGFDIEETASGNFLISGNQGLVYMDTIGHLVWEKKYTFMLDGVGSEVNNITRCKRVRDGRFIVAGQAYEGNCWTNFKQLYYDAWWSPVSLLDGTNTTWDTAGYQGGSDQIYDFTQLNNGNLIFVGSRYSGPGGIWTFVTDSSGKNVLWEKQTPVPYKTDLGGSARAYSVCATPDGGFTVAGELMLSDALGGHNAMAAHFVPISSGVTRGVSVKSASSKLFTLIIGKNLIVRSSSSLTSPMTASIYDISGKRLAMQTGQKEISFDISNMAKGAYFVNIKTEKGNWVSRVVIK
jgi:hypothetical protein